MDALPKIEPIMLRELSWLSALNNLLVVDCALRRDHWCSPVVVLIDGKPMQDNDGEISPFVFADDDRRARDWSMVPRVNVDGDEIAPTYRRTQDHADR